MQKHKLVVHIDDDVEDGQMVKDAIRDYDSNIAYLQFQEGKKALNYLNDTIDSGTMPMLVLLDMNMPGMDGRMILQNLKSNAKLAPVPVVLYTTSSSHLDKHFAKTHSVEFITKPDTMNEIREVIHKLITEFVK